ncbi:MAG: DUF3604 domain-containing protein [Treponema sp.]|nr:DUF3604 domain-containing protein [Treponema sp.]
MNETSNLNIFSGADVTPKKVYAGDSVEITIKLILGKDFSADNSRIVFDMPANMGYSRPTCFNQEYDGFMEVLCSNPDIVYEKKIWNMEIEDFAGAKPASASGMAQRIFVLDFKGGSAAAAGDELLIKWGYTRDGFGVGTKIATIVPEKEFYSHIHVRYFRDGTRGLPDFGRSFIGYDRPVPDTVVRLEYKILPREPESLRLIRKPDKACLMVLDRFSNIAETDSINGYVTGNFNNSDIKKNEFGVYEIKNPDVKIAGRELPAGISAGMKNVFDGMNIYFGDMHTHTVFSIDCIEREKLESTPEKYYNYAKNSSCLDFLAVTDHHQPWDVERRRLSAETWKNINDAAAKYNRDGEFAAFPGFEFRCERGDTAVVLGENFTHEQIAARDIKNIKDLWEHFKGKNYITIPHFHNIGSLNEGEWYKCPYDNIEPMLEIYSCHGSYESDHVLERHIPLVKKFRSDRYGQYFLKNGYHYGFTCNSDGHKGNPGRNGLTAVYAKELTRDAILDAIRKRHVYGTTNARIRLLFTMNNSLMGSILPKDSPRNLVIKTDGEKPIKAVDIFKNGDLYKRFRPDSVSFDTELKIDEHEAASWYVRVTQIDNHIAYSSPIWFE